MKGSKREEGKQVKTLIKVMSFAFKVTIEGEERAVRRRRVKETRERKKWIK